MPKSSKKKKDKVADFSRAKLKLGKGKAAASNAIDTSFKARSIALPSQSITIDKDGSEPITRRQLSFGDLISHLKHYNAGTRKDAILGLRELFDSNWDLLFPSLTPLLSASVRLIGDEDAGVRKQLLSFFAWLLPKIPADDLVPHSPLLLLFTTSAQTHIFPEIRIDAIRFLDILLECIPAAVIRGWSGGNDGHGTRVLEGYLGVLNAGTKYGESDGPLKATSTSSVVLTPASKLVILRSLSTFLSIALLESTAQQRAGPSSSRTQDRPLDGSFMKNAFPSAAAFNAFESLFATSSQSRTTKNTCRTWQAEVDPEDGMDDIFTQCYPLLESSGESWSLYDLSDLTDATSAKEHSSETTVNHFVAHLANTLHSTIVETYLDCAPSVFSPGSSPSETEVQLILMIVRIVRTLYQSIVQSSQTIDSLHVEHLESIVNYMSPYFPTSNRDSKVDQAYEEFNLIFCELTSLLLLRSSESSTSPARSRKRNPQKHRKGKNPSSSSTAIQTGRVTQYIIRRLRGEGPSASSNSSSSSSSGIAVPITPAAYLALLPTIWALISSCGGGGGSTPSSSSVANSNGTVDHDHSETGILHATLDHAVKVSSKSACKRTTVEFVARLMLLDLEPHCRGTSSSLDKDPAVKAKFDAWFLHLPQVLWEIGGTNIQSAEAILRVLLRVLQRKSYASQSDMLTSLQSRLVPYFHIDHPSRGPLAGPFAKLPPAAAGRTTGVSATSRVRPLALDVVGTLLALGRHEQRGKEFEALLRGVGLAVAGEELQEEARYWEHVMSSLSIRVGMK